MLYTRNYVTDLLYDKSVNMKYAVKLEKLKEGEKISIMSDSMFKAMLQNENRIKYSCKLISYYLDIEYEELLKVLQLGKNEFDKKIESEKGERGDYVANVNDSVINIEINCNNSVEVMERNMEYSHRLYSKKQRRGVNSNYTQVIQISINNFAFDEETIHDYYFVQNKDGVILNNKLIFIHIYIPNLRRKWYTKGEESLTEVERFLLTLVEQNIEDAVKLGKGDPLMEEYIKESIETSYEEDLREAYDKEWAIKDQGIREGKEIGKEIGRKEGIIAEKKQIVKNMLKKNFDMETIIEITGLSEQEIQDILNL